jgi:winged helix DNA-binding protein
VASSKPLTLRALNRATLARQLLLQRQKSKLVTVVERVAGLQAQVPRPPFIGLWSRMEGFQRSDLVAAIDRREIVRGTLMRATIHLVSRNDFIEWRTTIQPVLTRLMNSVLRSALHKFDLDRIVASAEARLDEHACTFAELRQHFRKEFPGMNDRAMGLIVRMRVPLIQIPRSGQPWAYHAAADFAVARSWLDEDVAAVSRADRLALRYLAAFGPATGQDFQMWSGLPGGRAILDALRPQLRVVRDGDGRELFDLPRAPLPDEDEDAPVRFLPEWDSVLLAHADRRRIIHDAHRKGLVTRNLLIPASFLVDGFVAGVWSVESRVKAKKRHVRLVLKPFHKLDKRSRAALEQEGDRLLRFVEPDAETYAV